MICICINIYLFFSFWLTSFCITVSRFIHATLTQIISFFWLGNIPLCIYLLLLPVWDHLKSQLTLFAIYVITQFGPLGLESDFSLIHFFLILNVFVSASCPNPQDLTVYEICDLSVIQWWICQLAGQMPVHLLDYIPMTLICLFQKSRLRIGQTWESIKMIPVSELYTEFYPKLNVSSSRKPCLCSRDRKRENGSKDIKQWLLLSLVCLLSVSHPWGLSSSVLNRIEWRLPPWNWRLLITTLHPKRIRESQNFRTIKNF